MQSRFLTNYTDTTFLATIQSNLRACKEFCFSVSFIKKAGLVLLANDIKSALERGIKGKLITSTYQNFTDVESLNFFLKLAQSFENFECHLDDECFYDEKNYSTNGFHTKGYLFEFNDRCELVVGSSNITRYALLKNIEWDLVVDCQKQDNAFQSALKEFANLWDKTFELTQDLINLYAQKINFAAAACICKAFLKRSDGEINPCRLIVRFLIPVRPDRSFQRNMKPQSAKTFFYRAA